MDKRLNELEELKRVYSFKREHIVIGVGGNNSSYYAPTGVSVSRKKVEGKKQSPVSSDMGALARIIGKVIEKNSELIFTEAMMLIEDKSAELKREISEEVLEIMATISK